MIKFFRIIRQNLLSDGKTGKYLKYAFGEIILVVIGILIALQINNWNEHRIEKNDATAYLSEFRKDLVSDTIQFNYMLTLMSKIMHDEIEILKNRINTEENLNTIWDIMGPTTFRRTINKRTYDNVQNSGKSNLLGYKDLYEKLSYYYTETNRDLELQLEYVKENFSENRQLLKEFTKEGGYEVSINSFLRFFPEFKPENTIPMLNPEKSLPMLKFINSIPGRNYITQNLIRQLSMNRKYTGYKNRATELIIEIDKTLASHD